MDFTPPYPPQPNAVTLKEMNERSSDADAAGNISGY